MTTMRAPRPASDKQAAFALRLLNERGGDPYKVGLPPLLAERLFDLGGSGKFVSSTEASNIIDHLLTVPLPPADPADMAAPGYYVRELPRHPEDAPEYEAFKVVQNKAGTATYAKRFTLHGHGKRPTWEYAPGIGKSLARDGLHPMSAGEAAQIGLSSGYCINCSAPLGGQTLSAHVSALIGYGETCAARNGWPYPKGAQAQRDYINHTAQEDHSP